MSLTGRAGMGPREMYCVSEPVPGWGASSPPQPPPSAGFPNSPSQMHTKGGHIPAARSWWGRHPPYGIALLRGPPLGGQGAALCSGRFCLQNPRKGQLPSHPAGKEETHASPSNSQPPGPGLRDRAFLPGPASPIKRGPHLPLKNTRREELCRLRSLIGIPSLPRPRSPRKAGEMCQPEGAARAKGQRESATSVRRAPRSKGFGQNSQMDISPKKIYKWPASTCKDAPPPPSAQDSGAQIHPCEPPGPPSSLCPAACRWRRTSLFTRTLSPQPGPQPRHRLSWSAGLFAPPR
nr:basic proline-rich protein-like isoform X1 [Dasypus novemcinctus]